MNNKHQENGALTGPLIFTLPASSFVVILNFDCLDGTDRAAVAPKTRGWKSDDLTENYEGIRERSLSLVEDLRADTVSSSIPI